MGRSPALTLTASAAGAAVVALDGTALTVAQPTLRSDLDASLAQVQWAGTGYLVAVAGLLVFAGRLGDRHGHRRLFGAGMLGFGAASAGLALAPDVRWVIGLRIVQGVFGALLQPATLGMLRDAYPPERLRTALAVRTASIGVAAAAGPVVGGALATEFGWRSVFLLNIVPTVLFGVLALGSREPARRDPGGALDLPGALLLGPALACLVHTLVTLPALSWSAPVALVAGVAFVRHERRALSPLLPPGVIGSPAVGAALGMLVVASAALNGALFACVYVLQDGLGLTALHSALLSLPLAVLLVAAAPAAAVLLRRAGARATVAGATAVLAAGLLVLARAVGPLAFCTGFALVGAGFGAVMVAATHVVVRQAPAESAGVAGGLQQTAMNIGPVLGVATATVLMGVGPAPSPLLVLALAAAAALPICRALPRRPSGAPPAACVPPARRRDATHIDLDLERGPHGRSLRDDGM
ncbi:MFS transporter [Streptomyces sp. ID05-04B]|uniref:MFS transporter n=1 Tax=unclassified Streptomyces TaxID=2593676 RepID=UPI000D1B7319|nr:MULTISPECIES: MFS transporter [unclassified Streptomyces]AVV47875.1 MFS transporter [Streptomyces sp. P3]MDX5567215.1 MFS transporter [Streptomyces sp. ID05-04B]